jgi:hypothetical protein
MPYRPNRTSSLYGVVGVLLLFAGLFILSVAWLAYVFREW